MKKLAPLKSISRMGLIATLNQQYQNHSPFFIQKDGKDEYDFYNDSLTFTCCNDMTHVHRMSPINMLRLRYIYGINNPCPYCNKEKSNIKIGIGNSKSATISNNEDISNTYEKKKYMLTDDPVENAKREAQIQAENNQKIEEFKKLMTPKQGPQRTKQKNDPEPDKEIVEDDPILESIPYDEYIKENPNYINELKENTENDDDLILPEPEEPIIESIPYNKYIGLKPDYDNPEEVYDKFGDEEGSAYSELFQKNNIEDNPYKHEKHKELIIEDNAKLNTKDTNILFNDKSNISSDDEEEDIDFDKL